MKKIKIFALLTMLCSSTILSFATNHDSLYVSPIVFDSITTIHFNIVNNDTVTLQVYDRWGNVVRTFFQNTYLPSGSYSINFIADSLPYGMYLVFFKNSTTQLSLSVNHQVLGINENETVIQKPLAFPNPTTGMLTIPYEGVKKIIVTDLNGRILKSLTISTKTVSLFDLNIGTYIVTILSDKEQIFSTQKIDLIK
jgi:hypothetical protein